MISSSLSLAYPDTYRDSYKISQFFLGFMFLFSGISEFKANRKSMAIINFSVSLFTFFVFIFTLVVRTG
ncbi:YczI family protein [Paenibacillus sp. BJ-4]|uniref:YczI family protein n=1 Tax=Paenibacillus sp. BJ-4 TaxID=2878097 RepID=UPI001CEFE842|nr:YczI family protein [Paenibacillus sp. BJ-4]